MARVSIVIPAFNAQEHLESAVSSVLAQTLRDLDVVIVNDGSTDATAEVAERLAVADPRVRVIHTDNKGVEAARNTGIECARGEWVAFLDADDRWMPGKLERQFTILEGDPALVAASAYGFYVGPGDRRLGVLEFGPTSLDALKRRRERQKPIWLLTSSVVCHRDVLLAHGGFDPSFRGAAEDLDLWSRIGERHDLITLPEHLVAFRISPGSASMTKHLQIQENTLRVRVNVERRARGIPPAGAAEFQEWLTGEGAETRAAWLPAWKSGYFYRQAGHHFLQRQYISGLMDLARGAIASPAQVAGKLRRQVWPVMWRGLVGAAWR